MGFPIQRFRRLRGSEGLRNMVRETRLQPANFVYPLFVSELVSKPEPIKSMPGVSNWPLSMVADEASRAYELGIPAVILFGTPATKDPAGAVSLEDEGIIQRTIRTIKKACPELVVITDVCLCEYTDHGHCGIIKGESVANDPTISQLAKQAVSHARAGADMVAPSDMMDGRVSAIRTHLDEAHFEHIPIMSYAAKYCSAFYGPFRDAVDSAPRFGDRSTYQMDPANSREAMREIRADIEEGADIVMVKPALAYLDIIAEARREFDLPLAAYNVSGEYAMVKQAAESGAADERRLTLEILTAIKRAGADIIITYHACKAAAWLNE